jgi:hypothetical protein
MRKFVLILSLIVLSVSLIQPAKGAGLFTRGSGYWTTSADETKTDFFGRLTDPKSQRENWYQVSPYIAEFWCMISNAGFIYAGLKHKSPELIFAGIASMVSHAIPKQWLLYVDKLGVAIAASKVIRNYDALVKNPQLVIPIGIAGSLNATDAYFARNKGCTLPHVVWHLSAAYISHIFLHNLAAKR